jgi:FkbM family methyltransferase
LIKFVDIGARGGITQKWRLQKDRLEVHAFEPNKDEWEDLKTQIWWEGVTLYPHALWSEPTTLTLNITENPGLVSVYEPLPLSPRMKVLRQDVVEARTLDSFNIQPDFIKIDTQGAELDILKGATESLKGCTCVEVEVEFEEGYVDQPLFNDVNTFLLDQGFYLWKITGIRTLESRIPFTDGIYFKAGSEGTDKRKLIEKVYNGVL